MSKPTLTFSLAFGLFLTFVGLVGWGFQGSLIFLGLLLVGLVKFLGGLVYLFTGRIPFKTYLMLFVGALFGFVVFDLLAIYVFRIWAYQFSIPNPFSNFPMYLLQSLGWGAFLKIFYDSYILIRLALDRSFPHFGLSLHSRPSVKFFSFLGVSGLFIFLTSLALALMGWQGVWSATLCAFGAWFILEDIEFKRRGKTLISTILKGNITPLLSILIGSVILGLLFEYLNIVSPKQFWVYAELPFPQFNILGLPIFLLVSWVWMYIGFLSLHGIIYKADPLWNASLNSKNNLGV